MIKINFRHSAVILAHAFIGWMLCAAIMGIGMQVTTLETTLAVHLVAAPIIFAVLTYNYFRNFHYTTPLQTAVIFLLVVVLMDFFVVAGLIQKSFAMFTSLEGTWLPFALIFMASYLTGLRMRRSPAPAACTI